MKITLGPLQIYSKILGDILLVYFMEATLAGGPVWQRFARVDFIFPSRGLEFGYISVFMTYG